jgi:GTP diphosphokinase / guanosine-3',5'-bis(diphosphate) 3'-diphosphatase
MHYLSLGSHELGGKGRAVHDILKAAHFAAIKHTNQSRKGLAAEPFINHLLEVAELVSSTLSEPDTNLTVAALLHDSIEDAAATKEELVQIFGTDVAALVGEVTDDKLLPKADRKRLQIDNAPNKSVRAQAITLADKVSNLRSMFSDPPTDWTTERKREYFEWAKQVVDRLTAPNPILKKEFECLYQNSVSAGSVV